MNARKKFLLRMDPELYEELAGWAAREFRSINGQIEYLLREAVARRRRVWHDDDGETPQEAGDQTS